MRELRSLAREVRMQLQLVLRTPSGVLFTICLPLALIPLLHALNQGVYVFLLGGDHPLSRDQYYVPAVAAFSIASTCFGQLAVRMTIAREQGVLKRLRGAPLLPATHLAARVTSVVLLAFLVLGVSIALGVVAYDVELSERWLMVLGVTLLGAVTCSALGLAASRLATTTDAAPAVTSAVLVPVAFLSSTFYPPHLTPDWMADIGAWLPLQPFTSALTQAIDPVSASVPRWDLVRLGAWLVGGALLAASTFTWVPSSERPPNRRRAVLVVACVALIAAAITVAAQGPEGRATSVTSRITAADVEREDIVMTVVDAGTRRVGPPSASVVLVHDRGDVRGFVYDQPCPLVRPEDVSPAWLVSITRDQDRAALVSRCGGIAFDRDGRCLDPCEGQLQAVEVRAGSDGTLTITPPQHISVVVGRPLTLVTRYVDATGRPASLTLDGDLIVLATGDITVRFDAPGQGGTLQSLRTSPFDDGSDGREESGAAWLSLPGGESDTTSTVSTSRGADGAFVAEAGDLRVEMYGTGPMLAWDQLWVVVLDGDQRTSVELRRS